jgi:phage baseplate assembly protein gpV
MINHMLKVATYGLEYFGLYYGTYRGFVKANNDPNNMGRLKIHCPTVHGDLFPDHWALPVTPYAGKNFGFWAIPDVGEMVHVRFDHGRLDHPMWEGGWWGQNETTPDMSQSNVVLATKEGLKVVLKRSSREILIQQDNGNSVLIDGSRITLNHHGDVSITAQGAVNITAQNPVRLTAPEVDVMGNLSVMGNLTLTNPISGQPGAVIGDISVQGKVTSSGEGIFAGHSVSTHVHSGVQSGASNTGTPIG